MALKRQTSAGDKSPSDRLYDVAQSIYRNYTARVFLQALITIWAVMSLTFLLVREMPGNPIDVLIEQILTAEGVSYQEAYDRVAASFNFDTSATLGEQYVDWFGDLIRLDLGKSITSPGTKVIDEIARFLPWTLFAVGSGLIISFVVGIAAGMPMAYYRGSKLDHSLSFLSSFTTACQTTSGGC